MKPENRFASGDNINLLRDMPSGVVDLCYLDPPYNSGRDYCVTVEGCLSQERAYGDMWLTFDDKEWAALEEDDCPSECGSALQFLQAIKSVMLKEDPGMLSYLTHLLRRLIQIRRVLKPTGTLVFHCDTHAQNWICTLLTLLFGRSNLRDQICWKRTWSHTSQRRTAPVYDILFRVTKSSDFTWNSDVAYHKKNADYEDDYTRHDPDGRRFKLVILTGPGKREGDSGKPWRGYDPSLHGSRARHWAISRAAVEEYQARTETPLKGTSQEKLDELDRVGMIRFSSGGVPQVRQYLDRMDGVPLQNVWLDINRIVASSDENLDFEGQKPVELLGRIILLTTSPGDMVLDPYAGTCTTAIAAHKHGRVCHCFDWAPQTLALGKDRVERMCGERCTEDFADPVDIEALEWHIAKAKGLPQKEARHLRHAIQVWAIEKKLGGYSNGLGRDDGWDGWINVVFSDRQRRECLIEVKTGSADSRQVKILNDAVTNRPNAVMGVFLSPLSEPTSEMKEVARRAGHIKSGVDGDNTNYPVMQFLSLADLFKPNYGGRLLLPGIAVRSDPSKSPEAFRRKELEERRTARETQEEERLRVMETFNLAMDFEDDD